MRSATRGKTISQRTPLPAIDEADIVWVCGVLGLPVDAFTGPSGMGSRESIIRSARPLDVEACPGSGKTTLLVAKLAILGRKWTARRSGLCVLSHTNVARREIETRLGNTAAARSLLAYPHFIGTIHSFVNEFLALPWLRSLDCPIEMIDDDVCLGRRWQKLPFQTRRALETNRYSKQVLRIQDTNFGVGPIRWGKGGTLGWDTSTYRQIRLVCEASLREGYFCHDEMFVWAHHMLDKMPNVASSLRTRFPYLFIDEVQDNSERQTELLRRVFLDGDRPVTRQRFGDSNQAIYQFAGQSEDVRVDGFPLGEIATEMPDSFRFGQRIADLVNPLAVDPQGLRGLRSSGGEGRHVVFLFDEKTIGLVLERYAHHLTEVFSEAELRQGQFTAIGGVHRPGRDDRLPGSVGQYWTGYDHEKGSRELQQKTFVEYAIAGEWIARGAGEAQMMVERVAAGVLQLARLRGAMLSARRKKRSHRWVLELLAEHKEAYELYVNLVRGLCVDGLPMTQASWNETWRDVVSQIAVALSDGVNGSGRIEEVEKFLAWSDADEALENHDERNGKDNVFRYSSSKSTVEVRVGSIHSVKGETHTATLVLDTFYRTHHLKALKGWLTGVKSGGGAEGGPMRSRLRLHYVAMSRASDMLCLAIKDEVLTAADIQRAIGHGWRVGRVTDVGMDWVGSSA